MNVRFKIFNGINYGGRNNSNTDGDNEFIKTAGHEIGNDLNHNHPDL